MHNLSHVVIFLLIYIFRNVQANALRRFSVSRVSCIAFQQLSLQCHGKSNHIINVSLLSRMTPQQMNKKRLSIELSLRNACKINIHTTSVV